MELTNLINWVLNQLSGALNSVFTSGSRLYWPYLVSFIVLALFSYKFYYIRSERFGIWNFIKFVFPKNVYLHRSSRVDYILFFINRLIPLGLSKPLIATGVTYFGLQGLTALLGQPQRAFDWTTTSVMTLGIALVVVSDFAYYVGHRLHHRWALIWPLHRLHHTAEVMTPITLHRIHPLFHFVNGLIGGAFLGVAQVTVIWFFLGFPEPITILGINALWAAFNLFGSNLRHSHIWLSWPRWLSHIIISPAQHQIHHSVDPKHIDKNYGQIFAIWDWMFGSLYVPNNKEDLVFGVTGCEEIHTTVRAAYLEPLKSLFIRDRKKAKLSSDGQTT